MGSRAVFTRALAAWGVALWFAAASGQAAADEPVARARVDSILTLYNENVARALTCIDTLSVRQVMIEPQDDGTNREARAVLHYRRGAGMTREETSSELSYPAGTYTIRSLIGPALEPPEYDAVVVGIEEKDGHRCYRVELRARVRDVDHIDGTVWIDVENPGPVRVVGAVSDPPFPASQILLDKAFEPGPGGLWLVSRHRGEVEVGLLFMRKRGERTILYEDYEVGLAAIPGCSSEAGGDTGEPTAPHSDQGSFSH